MLEIISNEQRKYFGLEEINPNWQEVKVESENFNGFDVVIYIDENIVRKCIIYGPSKYKEMQMNTELTKNLDAIVVDESNKKTSSLDSIINKAGSGVTILFDASNITIYNENTKIVYYKNFHEDKSNLKTIENFKNWVEKWCEESTEADIADVKSFASETQVKHIDFNEGDVFKIKLSRRLYGYGRILLSYAKMRNNKEDFWDCLIGTPVIASLYHILTEDSNLSVDQLKGLMSFPSEIIIDSNFYHGEYEIIGNIPVDYDSEDYPIMYGRTVTDKQTHYQNGKTHLVINDKPLYNNFKYNGVAHNLGFDLSVMKKCIDESSNDSYYMSGPFIAKGDLRNPVNVEKLNLILKQFALD